MPPKYDDIVDPFDTQFPVGEEYPFPAKEPTFPIPLVYGDMCTSDGSMEEVSEDMPLEILSDTEREEAEQWEARWKAAREAEEFNTMHCRGQKTIDPEDIEFYEQKEEYLRTCGGFRELTPMEFLEKVFKREGDDEDLPFEEQLCKPYTWWKANKEKDKKEKRPAEFAYQYNALAISIHSLRGKKKPTTAPTEAKKKKTGRDPDSNVSSFVLTSKAEALGEALNSGPFVVMSPVSYIGKRRIDRNARYLYAIAIDIDKVDAKNVENLIDLSDPKIEYYGMCLQPQIIVNSGGGIHTYYLLETPQPLVGSMKRVLDAIKKGITHKLWNRRTSHIKDTEIQYQTISQAYRIPGSKTKFGEKVTAWLNLNPDVPAYYSMEGLLDSRRGGTACLSNDTVEQLKNNTYRPNEYTKEQCKELFPEWYHRKVELGRKENKCSKLSRGVYDYWKSQIGNPDLSEGHRYNYLRVLVFKGKNCGVPREEVHRDVLSFVPYLDKLTKNKGNHFTVEDAEAAMKSYNDKYCTCNWTYINTITGLKLGENPNSRRRGDRWIGQEKHLRRAAFVRDVECRLKDTWRNGNGAKSKESIVREWQVANPEGNKSQCAKDTGLSRSTVIKWWRDDTPSEPKQALKAPKNTSKQAIVREWRRIHPEGRKSACAKETGVNISTVAKWWELSRLVDRQSGRKSKESIVRRWQATHPRGTRHHCKLDTHLSMSTIRKYWVVVEAQLKPKPKKYYY